jgi:hypothetical protein
MVGIGTPPEVDVPTAKELIEQIHAHLSVEEIRALVTELEQKALAMQQLLLEPGLDGNRVRGALESTFVARRRASAVMSARSDDELATWVADLLSDSTAPLQQRFERFCEAAVALSPAAAAELAGELLHFTGPDRYWLWSRWIWSADSRTGALALLIGEDFDLEADGLGPGYERVGEALRALDDSPEAAAFRLGAGARSLGTDVLLACTYGVYMRTVLGLKMTQEFNALVPALSQLARRLLGIHVRAVR